MKRFVTTLLMGAGLAAFTMSAARADLFTITRLPSVPSIAHTNGTGSITVNFLNPAVESPQADCTPPGTSATLLNYTVTTTGAPGDIAFNDTFGLTILWRDYTLGGATHQSQFNGSITGSANSQQDNLVITLTPADAAATDWEMAPGTSYHVFDFQRTLPPIVNDVDNPGAVSAQVVCQAIPEPGSMALLGTALLPILGLARRRRK